MFRTTSTSARRTLVRVAVAGALLAAPLAGLTATASAETPESTEPAIELTAPVAGELTEGEDISRPHHRRSPDRPRFPGPRKPFPFPYPHWHVPSGSAY